MKNATETKNSSLQHAISTQELQFLVSEQLGSWRPLEKNIYSPFANPKFCYPEGISSTELLSMGFQPVPSIDLSQERVGCLVFVKGNHPNAYYLLKKKTDEHWFCWRAFRQPTQAVMTNNVKKAIVSWDHIKGSYRFEPGKLRVGSMITWPYFQTNYSDKTILNGSWESRVGKLYVQRNGRSNGVPNVERANGVLNSTVRDHLLKNTIDLSSSPLPIPSIPQLYFSDIPPSRVFERYDLRSSNEVELHVSMMASLLLQLCLIAKKMGLSEIYKLVRTALYSSPSLSAAEWQLVKLKSTHKVQSFSSFGERRGVDEARLLVGSPLEYHQVKNGWCIDLTGREKQIKTSNEEMRDALSQRILKANEQRLDNSALVLIEGISQINQGSILMISNSHLLSSREEKDNVIHGARLNFMHELLESTQSYYLQDFLGEISDFVLLRLEEVIFQLPSAGFEQTYQSLWEMLESEEFNLEPGVFAEIVSILFGASWLGSGERLGGYNRMGYGFHGGVIA